MVRPTNRRSESAYARSTFFERIRNTVKRHWGKIALAGGVAALTFGGKPAYRYYRAKTLPRGVVAISYHGNLEDGRRVAEEIQKAMHQRNIAAIAVESAFATESNNFLRSQDVAAVREMANQWRRQGMSEAEMRKKLEAEFQWSGINPAFSPIYAEAVVKGIPIRLLENMTEQQSAHAKQIFQQQVEQLNQLRKTQTLDEARRVMEAIDQYQDQGNKIRDAEMQEELGKIREEFRKKGEVFAVVGEQHFEVAQGNRIEILDLANRQQYFRLDARLEHTIEPSLRHMRNTILFHLDSYAYNTTPHNQEIARKAAKKARVLTPAEYAELNKKFGNLSFLQRAEKIALALSQ